MPTAPIVTRPAPRLQPPFGPFDVSNPGGDIHTTLPPEYVVPTTATRRLFVGNFAGVELHVDPADVPDVPGMNTTPRNRMMSFLLPWYDRRWTDIQLTEHCWRSLSHFHLDHWNAMAAGLSDPQFVDLMAYVQSWGFYTSFWGLVGRGDSWSQAKASLEPLVRDLVGRGPQVSSKAILLVGKELNTACSPDGLLDVVTNLMPICQDGDIDVWLHFTSNYPAWPRGGQSQTQFWADMGGLGVVGLCWQGDPADTHGRVGLMGAHLWDARKVAAPLLVSAFESGVQTEQLYDRCDEDDGRRIDWELNCCPTDGHGQPPVAGGMGGFCDPDGSPILKAA